MPPKRRLSGATRPHGNELFAHDLDADKFGPPQQTAKTKSRRHSPPVELWSDLVKPEVPQTYLDAEASLNNDSSTMILVEKDEHEPKPEPWDPKTRLLGAIFTALIAFCATITFYRPSDQWTLKPNEARLNNATALIADVKVHISGIRDISITAVVGSSLDRTLGLIGEAKPYLGTVLEELSELDPQLAQASSRRKGLSCSLLRPVYLRILHASKTCNTAYGILRNGTSSSEETSTVIAAAKERYSKKYRDDYEQNLSKSFWRILPSWSLEESDTEVSKGKSKELKSVIQALEAALRTNGNVTLHLRAESELWDHVCRQFSSLEQEARDSLQDEPASNKRDCLNFEALSAASSQISGIVARAIASPMRG